MAQIGPDRRITPLKLQKPLNEDALRELALAYVSRFATSRAKLIAYLQRKLRERGWAGAEPGARVVENVADAMVRHRFVDDRAYAEMKADGLVRRGYGPRRIRQALGVAGIGEDDAAPALDGAAQAAEDAALVFARRRRIGPFARGPQDARQREKAMAAMLRAGHEYATARRILDLPPETVHNDDCRSEG
jgi:regulatory protein